MPKRNRVLSPHKNFEHFLIWLRATGVELEERRAKGGQKVIARYRGRTCSIPAHTDRTHWSSAYVNDACKYLEMKKPPREWYPHK